MDKVSGRMPRQQNILAVSDETEPKQENKELQQKVAELEKQLKQVTQSGARSAPNSSKKSDSRRSRGRRSAGQNSATPRLLALINLVLRRTRVNSATS